LGRRGLFRDAIRTCHAFLLSDILLVGYYGQSVSVGNSEEARKYLNHVSIGLTNCEGIQEETHGNHAFGILLRDLGKEYHFRTDSEVEAKKWRDALAIAIRDHNQSNYKSSISEGVHYAHETAKRGITKLYHGFRIVFIVFLLVVCLLIYWSTN